ncbi:MAG: hypothetical protein O2U61_02360 [Candidatus Bathyarchaeota archaeon]|nr:hypothetical protein [Candidatus Bathyarchaeota archaeon]
MKLRFRALWIVLTIAASLPLSIRLFFLTIFGHWKYFSFQIDIPWIVLLVIMTCLLFFAETKPSSLEAVGIVSLGIILWIIGIIIFFLIAITPIL